jgi:predicted TIM-barrel fold metal-dependent hydrolase
LCLQKEKKIYDIVQAKGVGKLIFGTDAPCPGGQKYAAQKVQSLPIPEEQKRALLGGTLISLLQQH